MSTLKPLPEEVKRVEEKYRSKIISQDDRINEIIADIPKYVRPRKGNIDILLLGETGTGKELFAEECHEASGRTGFFIRINCPAINKEVFESHLFGHAKGAFTGAEKEHKGSFKEANGGTLFLDEIGEFDLQMQAKLLRAIQQREIQPVGKNRPEPVDVMIIMATKQDLYQNVENGKFREDLFYRIMRLPINIPPLRERKKDIPLLVDHFIEDCFREYDSKSKIPKLAFTDDCLKFLMEREWRGNVRELEHIVERIVIPRLIVNDMSYITVSHLPQYLQRDSSRQGSRQRKELPGNMKVTDEEIRMAYIRNGKNKTRSANELGLSRRQIINRIKKMEEEGEDFR